MHGIMFAFQIAKKGLCNLKWYYKLCTFTTSIAKGKYFSPNLIHSNSNATLFYFGENNTTLKLHYIDTIFNKNEVIMVCTLLADPFFAKATLPSYHLWVHSIRFHGFFVQLWRFLITNDAPTKTSDNVVAFILFSWFKVTGNNKPGL